MNYSEKLKDPRWQKKRLEIFDRDEWCCKKCFDGSSTLCVHHFRYIPGVEPWDYPSEFLITLCEKCHAEEYEMMPQEMSSLVEQIKEKGFFHHQINDIACGFNVLNNRRPDVSSIIEYFLSTPKAFKVVEGMYYKKLAKKSKQ